MHKFLRSAGFGMYKNNKDIKALLACLANQPDSVKCVQIDRESSLYEVRTEIAPGIGVAMYGEMDDDENLSIHYYNPYILNDEISSEEECSIQRHAEKETYAGLLDEYRVGISLIFYVTNSLAYRDMVVNHGREPHIKNVGLAAFCSDGKILLPIEKTKKEIESMKASSKKKGKLIEAAKRGDQKAMETLTIEEIDLNSQISRRIMKEDIYSIVDSSFMPSGIECDQYSILGEICDLDYKKNRITGETIVDMQVMSNDIMFRIAVNEEDLLGVPAIGRRFKGRIWLMGEARW